MVWCWLLLAAGLLEVSPGAMVATNSSALERQYLKLLDKIIRTLDNLIQRTEDPSPEDMDRVSCVYGLNALVRNIGSTWGISMLDSATKLQSGLLNGNLIDMGAYDQCIKVSVQPRDFNHDEPPGFLGQHCLITMKIYLPNGTININGRNQTLIDLFGQPYVPLTLAHCYPSLCKPWVLEEALNDVFSVPDNVLHFFGAEYSLNVSVDPMDCHTSETPPYDGLDWTVMAIIVIFLTFGVISAMVDYYYTNIRIGAARTYSLKLFCSFSYYTNLRKLLSTRMAKDAMPCLNGLKVFSMCWVVLGHRYLYLTREPISNMTELPDDLKQFFKQLILNGPMAVDTFFMISGMLNIYGFCTVMAKKKRYTLIDVFMGYIHRYLRLTPAYLMMIGFTATWMYRLRDGPLWDRFVGDYKDSCRTYYWMNLVYLNNYLHPDGYCMMQSWYLAADMQLFWLSPFIIYPLWRWPRFGYLELVLLTIASILSPFFVSYFYEIAAPIPITVDGNRRAHEMALLYFPFHTKSVSYVLGIATGYLLYNVRNGKVNMRLNADGLLINEDFQHIRVIFRLRAACLNYSRAKKAVELTRSIGWIVTTVLMIYAIFGGYPLYQMDGSYNRLYSAFFIGFQRFFWSIGLAWIIIMSVTGRGGPVNKLLSSKVFVPLGRLTYCVYLTHIVVLMCSIAGKRSSFKYEDFDQIEQYLGDLVMCLFTGFILTVLVEAPMLNLEKIILAGSKTSERPRNASERARSNAPRLTPPEERHLHAA